jgi:hypothetical protein
MRKIIAVLLLVALQFVSLQIIIGAASAEVLGPLYFESHPSDSFTITSPVEGHNYRSGTVFVNFTTVMSSDVQFYDVGYSIDNGSIQRINDKMVLISDEPLPPDSFLPPPCRVLTYCGSFTLNGLSDGDHTLTLYYGSQYTSKEVQYTEKKERYAVLYLSEAHFSVNKAATTPSPTPTLTATPTQQPSAQANDGNNAAFSLPAILAGVAIAVAVSVVLLFFMRRRH